VYWQNRGGSFIPGLQLLPSMEILSLKECESASMQQLLWWFISKSEIAIASSLSSSQ
jgi:hypothetical protein